MKDGEKHRKSNNGLNDLIALINRLAPRFASTPTNKTDRNKIPISRGSGKIKLRMLTQISQIAFEIGFKL